MATCDPQALLNSANCFDCLTPLQLEQVQVQMLCDFVNSGFAGGPFVRISGDTMTGPLQIGSYVSGAQMGVGGPSVIMNHHGFEDWSVIDSTLSPNLGYAAFDAKPTLIGTSPNEHYVGFQSRPIYNSSGNLTLYFDSINSAPIHNGLGTVALARGLAIHDVSGTGAITNNFGVWIDNIVKGSGLSYALYIVGGKSFFGGNIELNTSSPTTGTIKNATQTLFHTYFDPTSLGSNLFLGQNAGNYTMGPGGGANFLGSFNVGIGHDCFKAITTGYINTNCGADSSVAITTGSGNSAFGVNCLFALTTGNNNNAMGGVCLPNLISGNDNTVIGNNSGGGITTGSGNVIIGGFVNGLANGLTNNVIIADGVGSKRLHFLDTGLGGMGTSTPQSKLDIVGNLTVGATYGGSNAAPTSGAIIEGQVGIGTNAPNANALLDLVSTTLGFKLPNMTSAQKGAIANTAGLMVFDTDLGKACVNNGAGWQTITSV